MIVSRFVAAAVLAVLTSCVPEDPSAAVSEQDAGLNLSPEVNQELAELRSLVAPFHDFEQAQEAGWTVQLTPCLESPGEGAMGFHYGNPAFIDAEVAVLEPELLVYEPQKSGKLRLVAVEYIIPFTLLSPDSDPPTLLGQEFHQNFEAGLWALHVWIGRHNPAGLFADWNLKVSCEFAAD
jgi:hypothetical protein